ncbi:MAG: sporulation protein [Armatimonadetes bacterium]|nr:sporulation protein [Armatimonadota bacterium]
MDFIKKVGAAVGLGGCEVEVQLSTAAAGWGEPVKGEVLLRGGSIAQDVDNIGVSLVERWETHRTNSRGDTREVSRSRIHDGARLASGIALRPDEERRFAFEMTVPWGGDMTHDWFVEADAGVPMAADPLARHPLELVPPAALMRPAEVLSEVAGMPIRYWEPHGAGMAFELAPEGDRKRLLDGIRLEADLEGETVVGAVVVNPQEHSVADVLKALVHADRRSFPVRFARYDLEAARRRFAEILGGFLPAGA